MVRSASSRVSNTDTQFSRIEPLKDFRRIATRYDRNAVTFLAAVCIAAAVSHWLWVRTPGQTVQVQSIG